VSFDNEHPGRKDRRRRYYRSAASDRTCRPHGSCPWCQRARLYKLRRENEALRLELRALALEQLPAFDLSGVKPFDPSEHVN